MSLIYLDNSATSFPKAPGVIEAVTRALETSGTSGRASYDEALQGSRILYNCRKNLSDLFGVDDSSRIILNSGATESLNTILKGYLKPEMKVLTSSAEHNAVMRPLRALEKSVGISLSRFANFADGRADMDDYRKRLSESPDLVVICHSSNVTGALYPVKEMIALAHEKDIPVCLDGAQSAGHRPVNLMELEVDFYCFSGHKGLLGPAGTGGFYIREGLWVDPLIAGGTGSLSEEERLPNFLPDCYESGTRNISGLAGLGAAVDYILEQGVELIHRKTMELSLQLYKGLQAIPGLTLYGPIDREERNSVISFTCDTMDLSDLAESLEERGIALRMGLHCAPSAHKTMSTFQEGGTIRLSPGYFTSDREIEETLTIVRDVVHE